MSEHKKRTVAAAQSTGIVVGQGKTHGLRPVLHAKMWSLVGLCVLIGIVAAVSIYAVVHHNAKPQSTGQTAKSQPPVVKARTLSDSGNYKAAESLIAQQVSSAKTATDKASWYTQASITAINNKQYQDALGYAQQAYQLLPNQDTAYAVAQVYEKLNDTANARKYLQLAIDKLDKSIPSYQLTLKQYNAELAGL